MGYIETENKYTTIRFPFADNDNRDYERALAKLIKSWWDMQYFYAPKDVNDVYMSEDNKKLVALTDKEVAALPDVFKKQAEEAKAYYNQGVAQNKELDSYYNMAKTLVNASSPEEGLKALEKEFGTVKIRSQQASHVHIIASYFGDHEYQSWDTFRSKGNDDTSSWSY